MKRSARCVRLAIAVALWSAAASGTDVPPPAAPPALPPPAPPAASIFVPPEPLCLEWTDGCRVCQKPATGEAVCSNIGVACLPQAPRCTRR
jgi:hypothetical protein